MSDSMELATSVTVADGTEATIGSVLYGGDGRAWRVVGIDPCRTGRPILARSDDRERLYRELRPGWMTSRRRDTMRALDGLARQHPQVLGMHEGEVRRVPRGEGARP